MPPGKPVSLGAALLGAQAADGYAAPSTQIPDLFLAQLVSQHGDRQLFANLFATCRAGRDIVLRTAPQFKLTLAISNRRFGRGRKLAVKHALRTRGQLPTRLTLRYARGPCVDQRGACRRCCYTTQRDLKPARSSSRSLPRTAQCNAFKAPSPPPPTSSACDVLCARRCDTSPLSVAVCTWLFGFICRADAHVHWVVLDYDGLPRPGDMPPETESDSSDSGSGSDSEADYSGFQAGRAADSDREDFAPVYTANRRLDRKQRRRPDPQRASIILLSLPSLPTSPPYPSFPGPCSFPLPSGCRS